MSCPHVAVVLERFETVVDMCPPNLLVNRNEKSRKLEVNSRRETVGRSKLNPPSRADMRMLTKRKKRRLAKETVRRLLTVKLVPTDKQLAAQGKPSCPMDAALLRASDVFQSTDRSANGCYERCLDGWRQDNARSPNSSIVRCPQRPLRPPGRCTAKLA